MSLELLKDEALCEVTGGTKTQALLHGIFDPAYRVASIFDTGAYPTAEVNDTDSRIRSVSAIASNAAVYGTIGVLCVPVGKKAVAGTKKAAKFVADGVVKAVSYVKGLF